MYILPTSVIIKRKISKDTIYVCKLFNSSIVDIKELIQNLYTMYICCHRNHMWVRVCKK